MSEEFSPAPERRAMNHAPAIDTSVPHSARVWNYWLGGKDNYPVDREAGDAFLEIFREWPKGPAPPGPFSAVRCDIWRVRRACVNSWTWVQACPRPTTPTRWPRRWHRTVGSSTSTTTRWS